MKTKEDSYKEVISILFGAGRDVNTKEFVINVAKQNPDLFLAVLNGSDISSWGPPPRSLRPQCY